MILVGTTRIRSSCTILVFGIAFFSGSALRISAQGLNAPKPEVVEDSFGNNWMNWDAKDVFLALPEAVCGLTLRVRAENILHVKGDRVTGKVAVDGTRIAFRIVTRNEAKLVVFATVVNKEVRKDWRLVRILNQWSIELR